MSKWLRTAFIVSALSLSACQTTGLPGGNERAASPESVGLSSERLARLTQRMQDGVARGEYPGAVLVIGRHGKIAYAQTFGVMNPETKAPMREDAIFRIASMTKPLASLAIMMLSEEGKLSIVDPVDKYIPEMKDMRVGVVKAGADGKPMLTTEPQKKRMTVQDLLRHTSGLPSGAANSPNLIKRMYAEAKIGNRGVTSDQYVANLGKMPLLFQPGTTWEYGASVDVLGVIVERVSGMPLDKFIAERTPARSKCPTPLSPRPSNTRNARRCRSAKARKTRCPTSCRSPPCKRLRAVAAAWCRPRWITRALASFC